MGYFERVRFLKKANTLTLTPVRKIDSEKDEKERVTLLVPRFKNTRLRQFMLSGRRFPFIRIHLDELGSKTWKLMDGESRVEELIDKMRSGEENLGGDLESRVTQFIFKLYQERYITFKEIE